MANYSNLKTAIENAVDWNNGDNEITGQNLLDILETIIDSLGAKYKFADVATPSSSISTPDEPLFYLAGAGTYANFSGLTVNVQRGTLAIFYYDTAWHWTSVRTDSDAFFNVNQYLEAPSTTYTKATGRNAVPEALRSKGMIITYLTTNGWIIEQNLSTSGTWNADANWQTIGPVSVSQNTLTIGGVAQGELAGQLIDNPEWVQVVTDSQDKILYGVKTDGKFYFGDGCPPQIVEYIQNKIDELSLDEYEDIVTFLGNLIDGDTLATLLNAKVDKVTGKSLINSDFASSQDVVSSPEWIQVTTDSEDKILEGIKSDGTKEINLPTVINSDLKVLGSLDISGATYSLCQSPEWIKVLVDSQERIIAGVRTDGSVYIGELEIPASLQSVLDTLTTENASLDERLQALESIISVTQNPEFIQVTIDSERKILQSRNPEGVNKEYVGIETPKISIDGTIIENIQDPEGRIEIKTDSEKKILSYRDSDGVIHEEVGIETKNVSTDFISLSEEGQKKLQEDLDNSVHYKRPNIPLYGTANIKSETFYLTKGDWSSYADDVVLIQVYDDTDANASQGLTLSYFYIKNTLDELPGGGYDRTSINANSVRLDFYPAGKVAKIDDKYYVIKSLISVSLIEGVYYITSTLVNGQVTQDSVEVESTDVIELGGNLYKESSIIEVIQCTDIPPYKAWEVSKKPEHYCIVDIDFEKFYSKTDVKMGVKYQGSSTILNRKRNYRFTFYKSSAKPYYSVDDAKFGKKDKVKFGDMLRLSGYNLKANWTDNSRIKEMTLYPTLLSVWQQRPEYNRFPWYNEFDGFTAATGFIQGFPIRLYIAGDFYGMMVFGLKKDEKNYVLDGDDDTSGIFVSGSDDSSTCWTNANASTWEDEMMDDMSQETTDALNEWFEFINDRLVDENQNPIPFNIKNIPSRLDVLGFIDYFICLQVFIMYDNTSRNMLLHSRSDKQKMYPFFYDLDLCLGNAYTYDSDICNLPGSLRDMSFWETIRDTFWDDIVSRYSYLRRNVLTIEYFTEIFHAFSDSIPAEDYTLENTRWNVNTSKNSFNSIIALLDSRLNYLDQNYFK